MKSFQARSCLGSSKAANPSKASSIARTRALLKAPYKKVGTDLMMMGLLLKIVSKSTSSRLCNPLLKASLCGNWRCSTVSVSTAVMSTASTTVGKISGPGLLASPTRQPLNPYCAPDRRHLKVRALNWVLMGTSAGERCSGSGLARHILVDSVLPVFDLFVHVTACTRSPLTQLPLPLVDDLLRDTSASRF